MKNTTKHIFLAVGLLLMAAGMQAQTMAKLIKKYKAVPEAQYQLIDGKTLKALLDQEYIDDPELRRIMLGTQRTQGIQRMEALIMSLSDDQRKELKRDIKALKHYEESIHFTKNASGAEDNSAEADSTETDSTGAGSLKNQIKTMFRQMLTPTIKFEVHTKSTKKHVTDLCILAEVFNITILAHMEGQIDQADIEKLVQASVNANVGDGDNEVDDGDDEAETIDLSDILKQADSCTVAFDGKIMPDLHNETEARHYIHEHNLAYSGVTYIATRKRIKERWPELNARLVIEYTDVRPREEN